MTKDNLTWKLAACKLAWEFCVRGREINAWDENMIPVIISHDDFGLNDVLM